MHQVQVRLCTDGSPVHWCQWQRAGRSTWCSLLLHTCLPACLPCLPQAGEESSVLATTEGQSTTLGAISWRGGAAPELSRVKRRWPGECGRRKLLPRRHPPRWGRMMFMKYKVMKVDPVSSEFLAYFCLPWHFQNTDPTLFSSKPVNNITSQHFDGMCPRSYVPQKPSSSCRQTCSLSLVTSGAHPPSASPCPSVPCHKPSVGTFPPETHTCANSIQLMLVMRG